jgi:hypothetical protein
MKISSKIFLILLLLTACESPVDEILIPEVTTIKGKILCNTPVFGFFSDVTVFLSPDSIIKSSNFSGDFEFTDVESKEYTIEFSLPGYEPSIINVEIQSGENIIPPVYLTEILPRLVKSFSGSRGTGSVGLGWTTETETNNQGFEIQKSNGGDFITIGFMPGAGTSTEERIYNISVSADTSDKYFRLKQISFDNSFRYSFTIKLP